jgi:hypothetical protein
VGNWVDYRRIRETVDQDRWQGNTFSGINTYTKIDRASPAADWDPEADAKGLLKKDDKTVSTTKGFRYAFDAWDRLVTATTPGSVVTTEYRYTVCSGAQRTNTGSQ